MIKNFIKKLFGVHNIQYLKSIFPNKHRKILNEKNKLFFSQFIEPNYLCFDIGANYGLISTSLLQIGAKVIAIEPQPECYKFLRKKFRNKILVINKAVGEKEQVKDMFVSNESNLISTFSSEWIKAVRESGRFNNMNWEKKISVQMTTIDKLIEIYGKPNYVKIDVEGYEYEVLKGLSVPIELISFEFTVPEQVDKAIQCIDYLTNLKDQIECNYALETYGNIEFCLDKWVTATHFKEILTSFKDLKYGDAFLRIIKV